MNKYLTNKGILPEHIELINDLISQFDDQLLYSTTYHRAMWVLKVEQTPDEFGETLVTLHHHSRKYKELFLKAIHAYGRRLYAK